MLPDPASLPPAVGWPHPLRGTITVPPHRARSLESLVAPLTSLLTPFIHADTTVALYRLPPSTVLPLFFALTRLQAVPVFLNDRYTPSDVTRALRALPCTTFLTSSPKHAPPSPQSTVLVRTTDPYAFHVTPLRHVPSEHPTHARHDLPSHTVAVFFTSGTTATPKSVPLTRQNLITQSLSKIKYLLLSPASVYLHLAPLYHLGGFASTISVSLIGGHHIIPQSLHPSNPAHAAELNTLIYKHSVSLLVAVPATLRLLLDARDKPAPSIETVLYGGSAASETLVQNLCAAFPKSEIIGAYGMTETASSLTIARSMGPSLPLPHVQLAVLKEGDVIVPQGHGEVLTKGPHVFPGYYGRGSEGFIRGWFRTGDIGELSDHGLTLLGRKEEMIKSGGEKVYAGEVESVLLAHSAVREAAVVGMPDRVLGEAVAACVVLVDDSERDVLKVLRESCRSTLAHFKCPRWILQTHALPRNATGKVVKTKVREMLESNLRPRSKL